MRKFFLDASAYLLEARKAQGEAKRRFYSKLAFMALSRVLAPSQVRWFMELGNQNNLSPLDSWVKALTELKEGTQHDVA